MAKRRARKISINQLRSAVETAVGELIDIDVKTQFHVHGGTIYGRMIRESVDLEEAHAAAKKITNAVAGTAKKAGLPDIEAAVLTTKGGTTVGFVSV